MESARKSFLSTAGSSGGQRKKAAYKKGKSMAKRAKMLLALDLTSALTVTSSFGQFSFDENGNGFGPGGPIPGLISIDPLTGLPALRYQLPFPTAPGDVLL